MQVRKVAPAPVRKAQVQRADLDAKEQEEMRALVTFLTLEMLMVYLAYTTKFSQRKWQLNSFTLEINIPLEKWQ